jgi:ribosomal protein S18 acetylase RimI-like enzyme
MQIRALTPSDAIAFQKLRLQGLLECEDAFASSYEEEVSTPLAEIELRLQPRVESVIFGGFKNAELVALVGLQRERMRKLAHKSCIWGVYVTPEERGNGVGTKIMSHALHYAATAQKATQVNLGVNTSNLSAVSLYKKLGFLEYGLERGFLLIDGVLHDEYQMVCNVTSAA